MPIFLATWCGGLVEGAATSVFAFGVWSLVDALENAGWYSSVYVQLWNAVFHWLVFLLFVWVFHQLRLVLAHQKEMASKDPLTGAFNSRQFYALSRRQLERSRRTGESFTVAYFDVDNFKEVNDKRGHMQGDQLLSLVVETVSRNIRTTDLFARLGGDEFAILQPKIDSADARAGFSKLIEILSAETMANRFPVTYSMGVVTFNKAPESIEDMIHRADKVMYRVKRMGKNAIEYEVVG